MKKLLLVFLLIGAASFPATAKQSFRATPKIIDIGSRLELFVDDFLIDSLSGLSLQLHHPVDRGPVLFFDRPWEGPFSAYCTILKDGNLFRLYYRGGPLDGKDGSKKEFTCYAESKDGIHWTKPNLKIYEVLDTRNNNVVLANTPPITHNFTPFLDTRPGVQPQFRYKALGGLEKTGLIAYVSPDGIHWKQLQREPVIGPRVHDFDSQNIAFWSTTEQRYVCYFRHWVKRNGVRYRSVARTTSSDFVHWTEPVEMSFGNTTPEQIYTNQTAPYFRAPHLYISVAARFMKNRQVLSAEEARKLHVDPHFYKDCSDAVFMTTRGGNRYDRTFMEGFIRPGIGLQNWSSRSNYPALNLVQTSPTELSLYLTQDYAEPTAHLERYSLRIDGFASIHAPYRGGTLVTKPFCFVGDTLFLNFSTSAAGFIRTELLDIEGHPLEGFQLKQATELIGNDIERAVTWKNNPNLAKWSGTPVRLRFVMKDADLYSFRFR